MPETQELCDAIDIIMEARCTKPKGHSEDEPHLDGSDTGCMISFLDSGTSGLIVVEPS